MRSSWSERIATLAITAVVAILVLYPLGLLIGSSFLDADGGLTLSHWQDALSKETLRPVLVNTAIATLASTAGAVVLGAALAFFVARTDLPFSRAFEVMSLLPFVTPPLIAGMAWRLLGEQRTGVLNLMLGGLGLSWRIDIMSLGGVIFVSMLYLTPFVFLIACNVLRSINPEVEEAATMSGAGRLTLLRRVTLPLLAPGLTGAALLAFLFSNTLFGIHATLGMPVNLWFMTTLVYQAFNIVPAQVEQGAVLACVLMVFGIIATLVQMRLVLDGRRVATIRGRGLRARAFPLGRWKWAVLAVFGLYLVVTVLLPYAVLFLRSLKPYMFQAGMTWADAFTGWQWDSYTEILTGADKTLSTAIAHSFALAASATILATALACVGVYVVVNSRATARNGLGLLFMIPLTMPGIVLGVAMLVGYSKPWAMLYGTLWILLIAYVTKDLPLSFKSLHASALSLHPELDESARTTGAGWWQRFRGITLPLLRPGIAAAGILTFVSVFREVAASIILYTHGTEVIAYALFNLWENGSYQKLSAFIVLTTVIVLGAIVLLLRLARFDFSVSVGATVRS